MKGLKRLTQEEEPSLEAALAWLRELLAWQADRVSAQPELQTPRPQPPTIPPSQPPPKTWWQRFLDGSRRPQDQLEADTAPPTEAEAGEPEPTVMATPVEAKTKDIPADPIDRLSALSFLRERLELSPFAARVLFLCVATELDPDLPALCARAQGNPARTYPTLDLARSLFEAPAREAAEALLPNGPLRQWWLIEVEQRNAEPLLVSRLRADIRMVDFIRGGVAGLDSRLAPYFVPMDVSVDELGDLAPSQQQLMESIKDRLDAIRMHNDQNPIKGHHPYVIQLVGPDSISKQSIAISAAASATPLVALHRLPVELLPQNPNDLDSLAHLWNRETKLLQVGLYLDARDLGSTPAETTAQVSLSPLEHFLMRVSGPVFVDTREVRPGLGRDGAVLDVDKPTPAEQRDGWKEALQGIVKEGDKLQVFQQEDAWRDAWEEAAKSCPRRLAGQFNLNLVTIHSVVRQIQGLTSVGLYQDIGDRLWAACLERSRPQLALLAQRIEPKATWDDLVLPKEQCDLLREIADQVGQRSTVYDEWDFRRKMNRGLGISALFAGESGTGKTMAAEVIANHLNLNLYRIDLSAVVSKYIGETEKNLRRLFDAAEDGGAILFFDEADALFGKRTEVKDSHDRYANIEINYLLQRMEAYSGLAILASNMKSILDPAFLRRLRFIVNFPFPSLADRKRIWERVFPLADKALGLRGVPVAGLDYDHLARLNLTGGSINNVAVNAAFVAAQAKPTEMTMKMILDAARAEFRKLERPANEADFRWREDARVTA